MSYGCKDRAPFVSSFTAQDGYRADGARNMVTVPFRMSSSCEYAKNDQYADKQCIECAHKKQIGEKS